MKGTEKMCGMLLRAGRAKDAARIKELLQMNGMHPRLAAEEAFLVAERDGEVLAALAYRVEARYLSLGVLATDPCEYERPLARALYAEAHVVARDAGIEEACVRPTVCGNYLYDIGYRLQGRDWLLEPARHLELHEGLPEGGWRRVLALWGFSSVPFFRAFRVR